MQLLLSPSYPPDAFRYSGEAETHLAKEANCSPSTFPLGSAVSRDHLFCSETQPLAACKIDGVVS